MAILVLSQDECEDTNCIKKLCLMGNIQKHAKMNCNASSIIKRNYCELKHDPKHQPDKNFEI